jgi:hypothetical protein
VPRQWGQRRYREVYPPARLANISTFHVFPVLAEDGSRPCLAVPPNDRRCVRPAGECCRKGRLEKGQEPFPWVLLALLPLVVVVVAPLPCVG